RIVAITAAVGASTGSFAGAGMVSVNLIDSQTSARIKGSTLEEPSASTGKVSAVVSAADTSGIISVGGAVGVPTSRPSIGAAIGYNEIQTSSVAAIESSTLSIGGDVSVTTEAKATIVGVALGVSANTGSGLAGAGSASINIIKDDSDAHVRNSTLQGVSTGSSLGGPVTVRADDTSTIVAVAGGIAASASGPAGGFAVTYDLIQNDIHAAIEGSAVKTDGQLEVSSVSSPVLVTVTVG